MDVTPKRAAKRPVYLLLVCIALVAALLPGVRPALAHAKLASSTPADGATIPSGLTLITIFFTGEISVDASTAQLINNRNGSVLPTTAKVDRANRKKMTIQTAPMLGGKYTIKWKAVTEDDNGISNGTIAFTVSDCVIFPETGKSLCGRFLKYWQDHGGLAQQGFPISDEF